MVDLIYNFIRDDLIGNTSLTGADNLALLLTWAVIVGCFLLMVRLVLWAFYLVKNSIYARRRGRY